MATFSDGGSQQSSTITKLTVNEKSYSVSSNSSVVEWKLTMSVDSWNFSGWDVTSKVWLDGELIYNKTKQTSIGKNSTVTLASGTKTIYHNDNGKKTINCKAETSTSTSASYLPGKATPSGTLKLTDIARKSYIDLNTWSTEARPVEQEIIMNIIKPNDNYYNKLVISTLQDQNTALATRLDVPDGEYEFQFTQNELNNNIYPIMTSNERVLVVQLITYTNSSMNESVGQQSTWYRGTIINADPVFSNFSFEDSGGVTNDSNTLTYELTGSHDKIIPSYSKLKVTIPVENKAVGQKGASIDGYIIANKSVNYSSTADVVYEIEKYPNESITVSAVDSRGNSKSITKLFGDNLINYTDIAVMEQALFRDTGVGEETTLSFSGDWWQANFGGANGGGVLNEITATYRYRIAGTSDWTTGTSTLVIDTSTFGKFSCEQNIVGDTANGFDIANSYEIEVTIQDKLSKKPLKFPLIAGKPAIAVYKNNIALGGQYDESKIEYPIQLNADTNVDKNFTINKRKIYPNDNIICVTNSALYELTQTNVYEQIQNLVIENQLGSDLSLVDNAIVIGEGISKILVNFSLTYDGVGGVGAKFIRLSKNEVDNGYRMLSKSNISTSGTQNYRIFMNSGDVLIDVVKGDKIMLFVYGTAGDTIPRNTFNYFIFTVRAVA